MKFCLMVMTTIVLQAAIHIGNPPICCCSGNEPPGAPTVPFDTDLYGLGYDVLLANGNPLEAFALAEKAVAARPDSIVWRRRAAQSGEWSGNGLQALEHWFYLAIKTDLPDAADNALRLARGLGQRSRLKQLLEQRDLRRNFPLTREYAAVCETLGLPEEAIIQLERHRNGPWQKQALEHLARLYESVGRPREAVVALLEIMSSHGITATGLLKAASLTSGAGDIQRAYAILGQGRRQIPVTEREYWQAISDLAWTLQDMPAAEQAARLLVDGGNGREEDYRHLILLTRYKNPEVAYQVSMDGWRRFGLSGFLKAMLELGISLKHYNSLAEFVAEQEKSGKLKPSEQGAYYWSLVSQVQRGIGSTGESLRCYREALKRAPADGELAAGYLWQLLELGRRAELRDLLVFWTGRERNMPALYEPFGVAHVYLGQYHQALPYFQAQYPHKRSAPDWLAAYSDILEQAGRPETAYVERMAALHLVRKRMKDAATNSTDDQRILTRDYARLAMLVQPGDAVDSLMQSVMADRQDEGSRELVAAWALSRQRGDLARRWFWREYAALARRPGWVELALALEENDRPKIEQLLKSEPEKLPCRDAIAGAIRVGWTPLAETLAFEHFQDNDRDYLLHQTVRELFGSRPVGFRYHLSLMDQSGIGFLEQHLALTFALSPRITLKLETGNTNIRQQNTTVAGYYPDNAQTGRVGLAMRHENGTVEIFAGFRNALSLQPLAGLLGNWKLDQRLTLDVALLSGAETNESVGQKIGGIKDEVLIGLQQKITPRESAILRFSGRILRDQDRNQLGEGASCEAELTHQLLFSGPDTTLRLFSGYHYYGRDTISDANALKLAGTGAFYFVPESFAQAGVGILIGQAMRDSYTRTWRPFAALDAGWNSTSGIGFNYEVGLGGPVFGLDKLEGAFSQERGTFGSGNTTTRLDLRYCYYF